MSNPPKWAQDLTLDALLFARSNRVPTLVWRRSKGHKSSSGHTDHYYTKIVITAGSNRTDQKLLLLHELAHFITRNSHTPKFWDMAWKLYRWAKLPMRHCKAREFEYKAEAKAAYIRQRRASTPIKRLAKGE